MILADFKRLLHQTQNKILKVFGITHGSKTHAEKPEAFFRVRFFDPREFCAFRFHADQKHTQRWRLCGVRF
jgi:hypothetical protein